MSRQLLATGVAAVTLALGLTACGGSDDEPKATATPTPTPAVTTTAAPPVQPTGANGVTYEIQNWDDYAADPAVLAWKTTFETLSASSNQGKVLPGLRTSTSKSVLRQFVAAVNQAKKNQWRLKDIAKVNVRSASTKGAESSLIMCLWGPTVGYYEKSGKYHGKPEVFWFKQSVKLSLKSGHWIITKFTYNGKCPGGAPA